MEIEAYGIRLTTLTKDKIELIRQWRNSPNVKKYMHYQEYITPQMQEKWFDSINNVSNIYFIPSYYDAEIGLINFKDINYDIKSAEAGIFIAKEEYFNTDIPIRVSLCGLDYCFFDIKLEHLYVHILQSNKRAVNYNKAFGYCLLEEQEGQGLQKYILTKENYIRKREYLLDLLID